ncbi:MAG: hypothetical protein R2819_05105 [Allomuricauda sp.]
MRGIDKSIFNLIEIFRTAQRPVANKLIAAEHCEQRYHHDYYCDAEKPFIAHQ